VARLKRLLLFISRSRAVAAQLPLLFIRVDFIKRIWNNFTSSRRDNMLVSVDEEVSAGFMGGYAA
jgi:hypothetical protein